MTDPRTWNRTEMTHFSVNIHRMIFDTMDAFIEGGFAPSRSEFVRNALVYYINDCYRTAEHVLPSLADEVAKLGFKLEASRP